LMVSSTAGTRRGQRGAAVAYALALVLLLGIISTLVFAAAAANLGVARKAHSDLVLLNLAEAGVDKAICRLASDGDYAGEQSTPFGPGSFSVSVAREADGRTYVVTSTGFVVFGDRMRSKTVIAGVLIERDGGKVEARLVAWGEQ